MTKKILSLVSALALVVMFKATAQEANEALVIAGSVDTYYTYDFAGQDNISTSFNDQRNSASIGMVDLSFSQTTGKASFVGEVAFGPRAASAAPGLVQNLYVSYALSESVSITGGFMGTFVGYEVISPASNFNYSTSYLFSNGPFQNAGLKVDVSLSDKVGFMVGVFQSTWDSYISDPTFGVSEIGLQLSLSPVEGWDAYINYIGGYTNSEIDLTTGYQISDEFYVGLNVANRMKNSTDDENGFFGLAGYVQYGLSEASIVGLRVESFSDQGNTATYTGAAAGDENSILALTLSGNFKAGGLTFIPEFRIDSSDKDVFLDTDGNATSSATQVTLAAVYAF